MFKCPMIRRLIFLIFIFFRVLEGSSSFISESSDILLLTQKKFSLEGEFSFENVKEDWEPGQ